MHKDLKNKYYLEWIDFLKQSEHWNREKINKYQFRKIQEIIKLAYQKTLGYKNLYSKNNISPKDIKTLDDFYNLPFSSKEIIHENLENFSIRVKKREYVTTGGSTGIPFGFYRDSESFAKELASKAYQYYRVGWKEGDRQMVFRGLPIGTKDRMEFFPEYNELRCSSYYLTDRQMNKYLERAWKFRPDFIKSYPSSIYIFAKFLKENNKIFPPIKAILCASENLYDFQKTLLREVFKCRVFSHYGHYEMSVLAGYCEYNDSYHVLPQYGFAELINQEGKHVSKIGETGQIVATSFIMKATPFIRYRTGDLAVFGGWGCKDCGRPYQIWKKIEGRLQEFVVTRKNRLISMTSINMHDNIFDNLIQFQFYQEKKGEIVFKYIPRRKIKSSEVEKIKSRLLKKFGNDIVLYMKDVEEIPVTKRGKHRFLIQKLNLKYGDD